MQPWIQTKSGRKFWLDKPDYDSIDIEDIAHALSNICRFTGHTSRLFSVAEHSIGVSFLLPDKLKLAGLLHDAAEAYIGDINTPLKHLIGQKIYDIESRIQQAIYRKYDINLTMDDLKLIKHADNALLRKEAETFFNEQIEDWHEHLPIEEINFFNFTPPMTALFFLNLFKRYSK